MSRKRRTTSFAKGLASTRMPHGEHPSTIPETDPHFTQGPATTAGFPASGGVTVADSNGRQLIMDALENLVAGLGTHRDKRRHTHYAVAPAMTRFDIDNMYRDSWAARKIIEAPAEDMTREWVDFTWENFDKDEATTKRIKTAMKRWGVKSKTLTGLKWGRLYGGATILIGIKGDTDMSKPLIPANVRKGSLRFLHVVDRWRLAPTGQIDEDLDSENFGQPLNYQLAETSEFSVPLIHWSRIIRFDGREIPYFLWQANGRWHDSYLQNIQDDIKDFDTGIKSAASMMHESNVDIIKSKMLAFNIGQEATQKVIDRWLLAAMMKSNNHMLLLDKEEDYIQKTTQFTGVDAIIARLMLNLSGAADIPVTRLFGQTPAGLSSTGEADIRNYYDHCSSQQESQLRPPLERLFEIIMRSEFGALPQDFDFTFCPLWQQTDTEKATNEYQRAQTDQIYETIGAISRGNISRELKERGTYKTQTDDDVQLAEDLGEQEQDMATELSQAQLDTQKAAAKNAAKPKVVVAPGAAAPAGAAAGGAGAVPKQPKPKPKAKAKKPGPAEASP